MPQTREHILLARPGRREGHRRLLEQGATWLKDAEFVRPRRTGSPRSSHEVRTTPATRLRSSAVRRSKRVRTRPMKRPSQASHGAPRSNSTEFIPEPMRETEKPFLMSGGRRVLDRRDAARWSRVASNAGHHQDQRRNRNRRSRRHEARRLCTGVEMFHKQSWTLDMAGDNAGLLLRGIEKRRHRARPWCSGQGRLPSLRTRTSKAKSTSLTKEEGGRHKPFITGYKPQFYVRTTDVTGAVKLPDGVAMVHAGRQRPR
jgi:elongation factor Tu